MTAPKPRSRKKPGLKKPNRSGIYWRIANGMVGVFSRYPRIISGLAIFGIVYSFIAANALWYQPGVHPAPILATRAVDRAAMAADRAKTSNRVKGMIGDEPGVSVFKIEREPPVPIQDKNPSALVSAIQKALVGRNLYDGPVDGMIGRQTTAAIILFEETEGLKPDGVPTRALLARLQDSHDRVAVLPGSSGDLAGRATMTDPIAGLIENDQANGVATATVLRIQKGLRKISYAGVALDGIAGEQTRAAIRSFEKKYDLPVTGEPSEIVLKKLLAIGAI